jgi:hypothetical protein
MHANVDKMARHPSEEFIVAVFLVSVGYTVDMYPRKYFATMYYQPIQIDHIQILSMKLKLHLQIFLKIWKLQIQMNAFV